MFRSLFLLMALLTWSASAGRYSSARTLAQLPQPSAADCQFTDSNSGVVSTFLSGFVMVTPDAATKCYNAIQIDYDLATESVQALADIFERTYVFVALAADPAGTKESNTYNFKVFDQKVDIPKELRDLADSFPKDQPVPLGDLAFPMNELFNRLRDAHVSYTGQGGTFGGVIPAMAGDPAGGSSRVYLIDSKSTAPVFDISIRTDADGNLLYFFSFLNQQNKLVPVQVTAIDGADPMNTLIKWADNPAFSWVTKALGTRINEMLRPNKFSNLRLETSGRLSGLENVKVEYADGTTSTLVWGVSMSKDLTDSSLAAYQEKANTLGVPIKALITFLNVYVNETERAPPATSGPPPIKVIAEKSEAAIAPGVTITAISNYGFYFFSGTRAVLKLNTFNFLPSELARWWPTFATTARRQGASDLILDLTDNGGGTISTGLALVLALYPDANAGKLGLTYDRIIGPDASYIYENDLQPKSLLKYYTTFANDDASLQARVDAINNNATEMDRLQTLTVGTFKAISALFSASSAQTQACTNINTGARTDCDTLWTSLTDKLQSSLNAVFNGDISADRLATLLTKDLQLLLFSFWPYDGTEYGVAGGVDQYEKRVNYARGGQTRSYTGKFSFVRDTDTARNYFGSNVGPQPPFQNIVAVGNGFCGSTCDTFSMSAWFYSKENPDAPKFKWATYGGTGKREDSGCTSFPGGNVNGDDLLTQTWAYEAVAYLQAEWAGDNNKAEIVANLVEFLPLFPGFLDTRTPGYTQSEIYRTNLGPNALPMEFYLIPPDYQIKAWYKATQLPKTGPVLTTDLLGLYNAAEQVLDQM